MNQENLENLFKKLDGTLDTEEPRAGHQDRFLKKLQNKDGVTGLRKNKITWWKPLSIAASIAILCSIALGLYNTERTIDQQVADISPEVANTQFYFASLIEEQVKQLESESSPETKAIIDDTLIQLNKLEDDYSTMEKDLINGGNSKMILSAMITNFQTRIDLLQDVLNQIETIKNLKNYDDENFTI